MSHKERRTARGVRPLSLLLLATLALLASSCDSRRSAEGVGSGPPANANVTLAEQPAGSAEAATGYYGNVDMLPGGEDAAGGERYAKIDENPFLDAALAPLSTFSVDVDTASYSNTRRFLTEGRLPPRDAVRIEELVNYFTYEYPQPDASAPFSVTAEVAECP